MTFSCTSIANLTLLAGGSLHSLLGCVELCRFDGLLLTFCVVHKLTGFRGVDPGKLNLMMGDWWMPSSSLGGDDADDDNGDNNGDGDDDNNDGDGDGDGDESRTRLLPTDLWFVFAFLAKR